MTCEMWDNKTISGKNFNEQLEVINYKSADMELLTKAPLCALLYLLISCLPFNNEKKSLYLL